MRFAVIARDPQVDLYREDDLYGVEVVEAANQQEALAASIFAGLEGLFVVANECADDVALGECDLADIRYKEQANE